MHFETPFLIPPTHVNRRAEVQLVPDLGSEGEVRGVLIYVLDITEHDHTLRALRESEARFQTLAEDVPVMVWTSDTTGGLNFFNRRWLEFTGRSTEQERGNGWLDGVNPEDRQRVEREYFGAFRDRHQYMVEYRLRRHDGEDRWVFDQGVPHYGADGSFLGFIGSASDIHDRKLQEAERARLLDQLSAALRIRDDFMAIASHELRTPLTSIQLQMEILRRALRSPGDPRLAARAARSAEVASRQVRRLNRLLDEMLDVSRIARLRPYLRRETLDLATLARETIERVQEYPSAHGIEIRLDARGPVSGEWDRVRLEQILENLLLNAAHYGRGRPVDVKVSTEGDRAVLRVKDQGIGIAKERIPGIFERFSSPMRPEEAAGLGLGLYLSRTLAEAHGGSIRVESEPGKGSEFTVELPLRQ